eukprot:TRINITY_DN9572_c0_g1_i2.p1 TRINITY_DN9572_c0_g1~~TRINITY_DN9572_c0_g1_i2.p1  ORF type:complete len:118 (+),score=20.68 TRINITY_DN9572_c0_g1_i2:37-354(+)
MCIRDRSTQSTWGVLYNLQASQSTSNLKEEQLIKDLNKVSNYWQKYEGEFKNGIQHGRGTLVFCNGGKIHGTFTGGKLSGAATFYKSNGEFIAGEWEDNILVNSY